MATPVEYLVVLRDLVWYVTTLTSQKDVTLLSITRTYHKTYRVQVHYDNEKARVDVERILTNEGNGF